MVPLRRKFGIPCGIGIVLLLTFSCGILRIEPAIEDSVSPTSFQFNQQPNKAYRTFEPSSCFSSSWKGSNTALSRHDGSVGEQRTFWLQNFTDFTHYQEQATLLGTGEYSAVFITNTCISMFGESAAIRFAEDICEEFDATIYPRITDLAGHPNGTLGDIDGDPRIVILVSSNWVSYYSQYNELPASPSNPYSNECEMIYIYHWTWWLPTIAHEFHHLIWFNTEMDEQQFALEGLATYAEYHAGYLERYENLEIRVPDFLAHPEDSLLYWNGFGEAGLPSAIDYGGAYLFTFYLAEKYGVDILRALIAEPSDGPEGIEATLHAAGHLISFNDLYVDWMTACTLDELGFGNNLYGYEALDARIHTNLLTPIPNYLHILTLRYYGIQAYGVIVPSDASSLQIHKAVNTTIGLSIAVHDTSGWQIQQQILPEGLTSFTASIVGAGIDEAYIIATFLAQATPPGHREYGLGPTTTIQLQLTPSNPLPPFLIPIVIGIIVILVAITITGVTIIRRQNVLRGSSKEDARLCG
jgi:hypothetical protein